MEKTIFCVDCDEVLRATLPHMLKIYNEELNDNIHYDDVKDFDVSISFAKIQETTGIHPAEWFFDVHGHELFYQSSPLKGAKKAMDILRKYGKVIVVTHQRSLENKLDTLSWLDRNKMPYDDICFLKDKSIVACNYLIDDNINNFKGNNINNAILVSVPYNQLGNDDNGMDLALQEIENNIMGSTAVRVSSLLDFAEKYSSIEDKRREIKDKIMGIQILKAPIFEKSPFNNSSYIYASIGDEVMVSNISIRGLDLIVTLSKLGSGTYTKIKLEDLHI